MDLCGYCGQIKCVCLSKLKPELTKEERDKRAAELLAKIFIAGLRLVLSK